MKLKIVVASMAVLGLISFPLMADTKKENTTTQSKKTAQHHTQHHTHHHHVAHHEEKGVMPMQPAPVVTVAPADTFTPILDAMTQNQGRAIHIQPDWFQRLGFSGGINVDGHWGNRDMGYMGENVRRISLNDAYLNMTALVNSWTKAFVSISYNNASDEEHHESHHSDHSFDHSGSPFASSITPFTIHHHHEDRDGIYSSVYPNNKLNLEQGYITIGNFDCTPFFVQLGKQFTDFGRYQIHPIERTMTQVLSESLQTQAKIGFITRMGINGSIYAFDDSLRKEGVGHTKTVYGLSIGLDQPDEQLGYDIGFGYMSSMTGVNDVAFAVKSFENNAFGADHVGTYEGTVGAWNVYGDVNSGPFGISLRYTTAAHNFANTTLSTTLNTIHSGGARPWAADVTGGYGFNCWGKSQNIYVGYQTSGNAVNLLIPKSRWIAGYGIDVVRNTTLSAEYGHDKDYSSSNGGTGESSSTIGARAAVKFG